MHEQERIDELVAGEAFGKRIELRAVSHLAEQLFGTAGRDAEHVDRAARGPDEAGHQVHERGFAGAIRADQAGDAGWDGEVHAIDAQHFAVEARDVVEDDAGIGHCTTSRGWVWRPAAGVDACPTAFIAPPPRREFCATAGRGRSRRSPAGPASSTRWGSPRHARGRRPRRCRDAWAVQTARPRLRRSGG